MPKKPEYLPRPLPPESDRELQQKLKDDESKVSLGLYVMRRTGLRIGELRRLERDCVRVDHNGGQFLKVPLGKMNNERLVPLDPTTLSAIVDLQAQAKDQQSQWLIEGARERPVSIATFQSRLLRVAGDMPFAEPLTTQDVIRWMQKELCVGRTERQARLLIRRLEEARDALSALQREASKL